MFAVMFRFGDYVTTLSEAINLECLSNPKIDPLILKFGGV